VSCLALTVRVPRLLPIRPAVTMQMSLSGPSSHGQGKKIAISKASPPHQGGERFEYDKEERVSASHTLPLQASY
jgi:hypothetical protein